MRGNYNSSTFPHKPNSIMPQLSRAELYFNYPDYLTTGEVAQIKNCARSTIWKMCDSGEIKHLRLGQGYGKSLLIHKDDVPSIVIRKKGTTLSPEFKANIRPKKTRSEEIKEMLKAAEIARNSAIKSVSDAALYILAKYRGAA